MGSKLNRIAGGALPSNNGGGVESISGDRSLSMLLIFVDVC